MIDSADVFLYRFRLILAGLLVIAGVVVLPFLISMIITTPKAQAHTSNSSLTLDNNPNVIAEGFGKAANELGKAVSSVGQSLNNAVNTVTASVASATTASGKAVVHGVGSGAGLMARGATSGVAFVAHTTGGAVSFIAKTPGIDDIIKPAEAHNAPVPVIDTDTSVKANVASIVKKADNQTPQAPVDSTALWPINGEITLEFGVPHWPYQKYHTGIDISDGKPAGVTPIHSFKPGKVIAVIQSWVSFGNHVIIDNGDGITSLYGHMSATAVQVGQVVDKNTVLGYEGNTGASEGVHLHFEIRLNGQPVNPHKYVDGHP